MPHLNAPLSLNTGPAVHPIIGNDSVAGACYDGHGQALWIANVGGSVQVWRTRTNWRSLLHDDGSVDYLSTVVVGKSFLGGGQTSAALWRVNGTLYASVAGTSSANLVSGHWLYRDTSASQDGSGPWVKHGDITAEMSLPVQPNNSTAVPTTGEIVVVNGRWATPATFYSLFAPDWPIAQLGVATSDDGGLTWTQRTRDGWYGGTSAYGFSRNFGKFGGAWYVGGIGNVNPPAQYKSTDLANWASITSPEANAFPASAPDRIYRQGYYNPGSLYSATAAPETSPAWTLEATVPITQINGGFDHLADISGRGAWVMIRDGQVARLATGLATAPPCRQYPATTPGLPGSARQYPLDRSRQGGFRQTDYY